MPSITLPNAVAPGDLTSADKIAEDLSAPNSTPDSFDVINGFLDGQNLDPIDDVITHKQVKRGTFARARMVGSTADLDYFSDYFQVQPATIDPGPPLTFLTPGTDLDDPANDLDANYVPVSGGSVAVYNPYHTDPTAVLFFWAIAWANDARFDGDPLVMDGSNESSVIKLFIDSVGIPVTRRAVRRSVDTRFFSSPDPEVRQQEAATISADIAGAARHADRYYAGHYLFGGILFGSNVTRQVSLRICSNARHARVRVRRMGYVIMP